MTENGAARAAWRRVLLEPWEPCVSGQQARMKFRSRLYCQVEPERGAPAAMTLHCLWGVIDKQERARSLRIGKSSLRSKTAYNHAIV
jgi:hypothetical protein